MKKRAMKALSLILSLSLLLSVMSFGSINAFAGSTIVVTSEDELYSALNKTEEVSQITIDADISITKDCTIKYNAAHLDYYKDTVVTVNSNRTVTIEENGQLGSFWPSYGGDWEAPPFPNGQFINSGKIIVHRGGAIVAGFDENNGEVLVQSGGQAVVCKRNYGSVTVEAGGVFATSQGDDAYNRGSITINRGAIMEARFGTSIVNEQSGTINLDGKFICNCINLNGNAGFWFDNKGTVTGRGDVILQEADHDVMPVPNMDGLIESMMAMLGQTSRFDNWEDINIFKKVYASNYDEFAAALSGNRVVAGEQVAGNMDTIVELTADVEIPKGKTFDTMAFVIVTSGKTLSIDEGAELTCGMDNSGTVIVHSGAKLSTTMGSGITNHNTLIIENGAELRSQMGGEVVNDAGATLTLDGTFYCGCFGDGANDICWFDNHGNVNGSGNVVLYQANPESNPVSDMASLTRIVVHKITDNGGAVNNVATHTSHTWDSGVVIKPATITATGVKTVTCTVCGATENRTIAKLPKKANTLTVKGKTTSVKYSKLKKKAQTVKVAKAMTVSGAKGGVTYAKAKGNKKITVAKNGKITVKKGLKKGKYKVKIKVTAAGDSTYNAKTVTVTVTIKVK